MHEQKHLDDRIYYELPIAHPSFEAIRKSCVNVGHETIDDYRKSNDGLLVVVASYVQIHGLTVFNPENENWVQLDELF